MPNQGPKNVIELAEIVPQNEEVLLTWEDLWVTTSSLKDGNKAILKGLTGYARPGELLAIMGPSGCGKSTLLDTIAGRLGSSTRQSGDILINGRKQTLAYGTSAYVTQEDTLMATLTVKEAVYYSAELQLPNSMPKSEKKQIADMTMKEMGLQDAMETRIGGWSGKGISGGQKRRVSICLEILTRPKLLFLDEPTSGLDSAASYYVMKTIASQCKGRTIIASIHQPSAEVFNLFHSLCLLSSGRTVYFGPANAAIEFFALSGYPCPTLQNPSDHFLKTINSDFDQDIEEGPIGRKSTEEAYVTQEDTLMATLTVKEAVYYSAELQLPDSMPISEKRQIADMTIKEMGLQDAMETRIGGWSGKGISGGQKRRVSICLEILTRPKLLFLDEPTSGLDSAASYYVMKTIASQCQGRTIIASIHQPSAEVFNLFHSLCLLSSGRTVYFGPANAAIEFFALSGYPCPTLQNPSDHFLKTINSDFDQDIEEGPTGQKSTEEVINILIKSYNDSDKYRAVQSRVAEISKQEGEILEKRSRASFTTQTLVLTRRSFLNMFRDLGYYWLRLAIHIVIGVGLGTIYYDVGFSYSSIQARGSMLMFVASFMTFLVVGGFPSFVEELKVFQRENLNGHYGSVSFAIANTLSAMPYLVLISFIPGVIAYFLTGLQGGLEHIMFFALVLFICMVLVESLMMIVASIVPNFLMGLICGSGILALMCLSGGFFRLPNDLPKVFWKYPLHYVGFHKYAYQGLYKNEFQGLKIHGEHMKGLINGEDILRYEWQMDMDYSKWVDLAILVGMVILYRLLFLLFVKASEKLKPAARAIMSNSPKQINSAETPLHDI